MARWLGEALAVALAIGGSHCLSPELLSSAERWSLGPLTLEQYNDFLPGGEGYRHARSLTTFYAGGEYDVELQLILRREEVPPCELAAAESGPQLGWTTWVKSKELNRDPGETILEL